MQTFGQISDLSILTSSRGASVTTGLTACWTVGESFTEELSNNAYCMAQGFHQGAVAVVALGVTEPLNKHTVVAYPNPTHDQVTLKLDEFTEQTDWQLELITIDGKVMHKQIIESTLVNVDFINYPQGTYLIKISNKEGFCNIFTITKQ